MESLKSYKRHVVALSLMVVAGLAFYQTHLDENFFTRDFMSADGLNLAAISNDRKLKDHLIWQRVLAKRLKQKAMQRAANVYKKARKAVIAVAQTPTKKAVVEEKKAIGRFAEGEYSLYRIIWKKDLNVTDMPEAMGTLRINFNSDLKVSEVELVVDVKEEASGENREVASTSVAASAAAGASVATQQLMALEMEVEMAALKSESVFSYYVDGEIHPATIRRLGTHDVIITPLDGQYRGARLYFSSQDKSDEMKRVFNQNGNIYSGSVNVPAVRNTVPTNVNVNNNAPAARGENRYLYRSQVVIPPRNNNPPSPPAPNYQF